MWGRGRSNLGRVRDRTGGLVADFFTQIPETFLRLRPEKSLREIEAKS
jgi:hypothetical protein